MYIFYFSVHLLSAVSKKTSRNVGFQTPCLHLCVAKHQTACTIRLIFLRCSPGRYIGQKNVKTKKTNIEVTSESEEHAFSIDFWVKRDSGLVHLHLTCEKKGLISWGPMLRGGGEMCCSKWTKLLIYVAKRNDSLAVFEPFFQRKKSSKPSFTQTKSDWDAMFLISKKDQKKLAPFSWGLCAWQKGQKWQLFEFHLSCPKVVGEVSSYIQFPHGWLPLTKDDAVNLILMLSMVAAVISETNTH